ncbi:D-alanine--D-alanine ligase family protein [Endozoicomonas arenosclerae]|uniref:D-alanine--D-alanine ligase family protein n=1 Tax=Endozoicomonas arenosclerae TaxID=1633495 RepID=UPI000781B49F|nr:D-alanine--D-alanine ligase [Endozoicomonas arenosclerae]
MPDKSKTIAVICGGLSPEADVSRLSANRITPCLEEHYGRVVHLELDQTLPEQLIAQQVDVAFPVAHGPYGEDGRLQGLLDIMGVPYVGSGALASACSLDKVITKRLLQSAGIPMAKDRVVYHNECPDEAALDCVEQLGPKVIIKPSGQGSGIGVQFAMGYEDLKGKLKTGLQMDEKLLVEEFVTGKEITAGVLHLDDYQVLPVTEITTPDGAWYDYVHRYTPGLSDHVIPARISDEQYRRVQEIALKAHQILGCHDISRSDFIVPESGEPVFAELNNLPGMTPTSLFPDGARHAGISFEALICKLVDQALKRGETLRNGRDYWPIPKLDIRPS